MITRRFLLRSFDRGRLPPKRARLLGLALAAALISAGCGGGGVDTKNAEGQIKSGIDSKTGADVQYVHCPDSANAQKGAQFHCTALVPVTVTQLNDKGSIRWQITSLSGKPLGATGATGPTTAGGPTGANGPTGKAPPAAAKPAGGGRFVVFRNRSQSYAIGHPGLWQKAGTPADLSFNGPNGGFVHIVTVKQPPQKPAQLDKETRSDPRFTKVSQAKSTKLGGRYALTNNFVFKAPTGRQLLYRYRGWRGGTQVTIEIGGPQQSAKSQIFNAIRTKIVRSFNWI
jgi:hypothetical protein